MSKPSARARSASSPTLRTTIFGRMLHVANGLLKTKGLALHHTAKPGHNSMTHRFTVTRLDHSERTDHSEHIEAFQLEMMIGGSPLLHVHLRAGDDDTIASIAVPGLAVWFGSPWLHRRTMPWLRDPAGEELELGVHVSLPNEDEPDRFGVGWSVLGPPPYARSSGTPWWRSGSVDLTALVLGSVTCTSRLVAEEAVLVPMPERSYRWTVRLEELSIRRARWPFTKHYRTATCNALEGEQIPFPGRGESDYDDGEDASFGLTVSANTIGDAVAEVVADVLETRLERGSEARPAKRSKTRGAA